MFLKWIFAFISSTRNEENMYIEKQIPARVCASSFECRRSFPESPILLAVFQYFPCVVSSGRDVAVRSSVFFSKASTKISFRGDKCNVIIWNTLILKKRLFMRYCALK